MGVESFRTRVFWIADVDAADVIAKLRKTFSVEQNNYTRKHFFHTEKIFTSDYRIEQYVIASFGTEQKVIDMEACYSSYSKYCEIMYRVYDVVFRSFGARIGASIEHVSDMGFKSHLESYDMDKFFTFQEWYGITDTDMLPGVDFFRKNKMKPEVRRRLR